LSILLTGVWKSSEANGVTLTIQAFETAIPFYGKYILTVCATIFAVTSLFSLSYYGEKCFSYLFGAENKRLYNYFYVSSIVLGAVASLTSIIGLIDGMYATMAIPTTVSALMLSPKVRIAALDYFARLKEGVFQKAA
jgi:AGCS family alanine or glycine:cation symporter